MSQKENNWFCVKPTWINRLSEKYTINSWMYNPQNVCLQLCNHFNAYTHPTNMSRNCVLNVTRRIKLDTKQNSPAIKFIMPPWFSARWFKILHIMVIKWVVEQIELCSQLFQQAPKKCANVTEKNGHQVVEEYDCSHYSMNNAYMPKFVIHIISMVITVYLFNLNISQCSF